MSSPYPVIGNRSIDQLKVTELKQELKKRELTISGLKSDLIKRLDEAIRIERKNAGTQNPDWDNSAKDDEVKDTNNGFNSEPQTVVVEKDSEAIPITTDEPARDVVDCDGNKSKMVDGVKMQIDINDSAAAFGKVTGQDQDNMVDKNAVRVEEELRENSTSLGSSVPKVSETVVSDLALSGLGSHESETPGLNLNLNSQLESEDSKPQMDNEVLKAAHKDAKLDSSASDNQVSEVNPSLGIQVKSDSICTDSVSINEKIELKGNIISDSDNVKIVLDVIKPEMVEPSSSNVVPLGGESHPMDVEEPLEKKISAGKKDDKITANADANRNNDSADPGSSEKLNLDRSSGDDSMEEDVLESKQIESKYNSDEVGNKNESKVSVVNEEINEDVIGVEVSADGKGSPVEKKSQPAVITEKRKLNDEKAVGSNEPVKRQRRWNSESLKIPEQQSSNITVGTAPKDSIQSPALKRNFSRSYSTASDEAPKERIVPPAQKAPTNSLRIDNFLRPFTLKAVQELLGKTGTVSSFWMDQIKTHCYVSFSSVEEAMETRNAVYNLQWPPNGGRLLVAEFVDPEEVNMHVEPPKTSATPISAPKQPLPSPRQQPPRQQLPPPPPPTTTLPPPPPLFNVPLARERNPLPPAPPREENVETPIVTLDDLFRKTKAAPRIYYLPLSEEQVAARAKNTKQ
ncbi:uncharacterized protein [Rutidosis leptorrhynchoides]|uniref:uncharacterized protein n=1 Tax=Rutidosis leptorrhynchoides TaxID=125765 RepID=UPI003A990580